MKVGFVISSDLGLWSGNSFGGWRYVKYYDTREEALEELEKALTQIHKGCPCEIKEMYYE